MSEGPSTRTKRGRTRSIVRATSRAHAGLWWRTPTAWRVTFRSYPVHPERGVASRASEASSTRDDESKGVSARLHALRLVVARFARDSSLRANGRGARRARDSSLRGTEGGARRATPRPAPGERGNGLYRATFPESLSTASFTP